MIETTQEVITASIDSELGSIMFLAMFFSFLLIPYAAMALTERTDRSVETLDRMYDIVAAGTAVGVIGLGINAGIKGILSVMIGVGYTTVTYATLIIGLLIIVGITNLLTRNERMYRLSEE